MRIIHTEFAKVSEELEGLIPAGGNLPCLTVITFQANLGVHLRRELVRKSPRAGIRFVSLDDIAEAALYRAGIEGRQCSSRARALGLDVLLRTEIKERELEYFDLGQVRAAAGYSESFTRTIDRLAAEGVRSDDLRRIAGKGKDVFARRLRDLAFLTKCLSNKSLLSLADRYVLARKNLNENPEHFPWPGPVAAVLDQPITTTEATFLSSIPNLTLLHCPALPERPEYQDRLKHLSKILGVELTITRPEKQIEREIDLLRTYLFERPHVLSDSNRARSKGPDGSVSIETTSGMEEELERACDWVAGRVSNGVRLDKIAVLCPKADPLIGILHLRLARMGWSNEGGGTFVSGGLPAVSSPGGYRVAKLILAILEQLHVRSLVDLVPFLTLENADEERSHLTRSRAIEILYSAGTLGGSPAHPEAFSDWLPCLKGKVAALKQRAKIATDADDSEKGARGLKDSERMIHDIEGLLPPLQDLTRICQAAVAKKSLNEIWQALEKFSNNRLRVPPEGAGILGTLRERVPTLASGWLGTALTGVRAVGALERELQAIRLSAGKLGEPRVYLGTIEAAQGLNFEAVRIIGLAEGEYPGVPSEDPILPELDRQRLEAIGFDAAHAVPGSQDRATGSLHALWRLLRGVSDSVVFSAPRESLDRQAREPSGVLLEVASALWRHDAQAGPVPSSGDFETHYLRPGAETRPPVDHLLASRNGFLPMHVARMGGRRIPASWGEEQKRIQSLRLEAVSEEGGVGDGFLSSELPLGWAPGLKPEQAISASRLGRLLGCPHRFLFQDLLGWEEPPEPPTGIDVDAMSYGGLLHEVQEKFLNQYGKEWGSREKTIKHWITESRKIADEALERFLLEYPLLGSGVQRRYRERLRNDIRTVLSTEWKNYPEPISSIEAERSVGFPNAVPLPTKPNLYVHGYVDRIDRDEKGTVIRDLKSGRSHPRVGDEAEAIPPLDIQLGVYALALDSDPTFEGPKVSSVSYVYAKGYGSRERSFREDYGQFIAQAKAWLSLGGNLLKGRDFPRTVEKGDCQYCPFKTACGTNRNIRARQVLENKKGVLTNFLEMKAGAE